jgi:hypothetical protein
MTLVLIFVIFHFQLINSSWKQRSILWTTDTLYFYQDADNYPVDLVLLYQIESVTAIRAIHNEENLDDGSNRSLLFKSRGSVSKLAEYPTSRSPSDSNADLSHFDSLIQIQTASDGHNFGRTYYIYCPSEHQRQKIVDDLSKVSKQAAARKLAVSKFIGSQAAVRSFYDSGPFQIFVGVLILTVSPPLRPHALMHSCINSGSAARLR